MARKYYPNDDVPKHKKRCKRCLYSESMAMAPGGIACFFVLVTKKRRGCPAENCDKFVAKKRGKKKVVELNGKSRFVDC